MPEYPTWVRALAPIAVVLLLACGPCSLLGAQVPTPTHPIVVSTEAAGQLESRIQQNLRGERGQQFVLRATDSEVTSLLATKLGKHDESPVADPQVWFTGGRVFATGRLVNVLPIRTSFYLVASARISDGQVLVAIEESSAGAIPLPKGVLDTLSQSLSETMNELQLDVQVTDLEILEGEAIIRGVRR